MNHFLIFIEQFLSYREGESYNSFYWPIASPSILEFDPQEAHWDTFVAV